MSTPVLQGRVHPLAAVLSALAVARGAVPALAGFWIADVPRWVMVGGAAAILLIGAPMGLLHWWRFRYRVVDGRLEVDAGVLVRRRRVVPLERIRGVTLEEPPLHRLLGLVRARVEAAVAGDPSGELALTAVTRTQAEALRDAVVRGAPAGATAPADEAPLVRMTAGRLLLAGATSGRYILVPLALAGAAYGLLDDLGLRDLIRWGADTARERAPHTPSGIVVSAVLAGAFAVAVAALGSLVADWDFRMHADARRVRTERGLLSRRRTAADRRRLLGVEVRDSPLRRALGMAAVDAPVGGMTIARDFEAVGRVRLMPMGDRAEVARVMAELAPGARPPLTGHPVAGRPRRIVRATAIPLLGVCVAAALGRWWEAAGALAAVGAMTAIALRRHRALGHGLGRWLELRSGWFAGRRTVLDPHGVVGITISSGPFQRRRGLVTTRVHLGLAVGSRTAPDTGGGQASSLATGLYPWLRDSTHG